MHQIMELLVPPHLAARIWWIAWLNLITGLYGFWRGHTHMAPYMTGIWATSLLYWRRPTFGWRRRLDIGYCQVAIWYHIYKAWDTPLWFQYYILLALGLGCYPISCWYHWNRARADIGTGLHMLVHIVPNLATMMLYAQDVIP